MVSATCGLAFTLIMFLVASACNEPAPVKKAPDSPLAYIPEGTSKHEVYNVSKIMEGGAPEDALEQYKNEFSLENIGIRIEEIHLVLAGQADGPQWIIVHGTFTEESMHHVLGSYYPRPARYKGYRIWGFIKKFVYLEEQGILLYGSEDWIKAALDAVNDGTGLLSADAPARQVAEKVDSWHVKVTTKCTWFAQAECQAEARGKLTERSESGEVWEHAYMFESEEIARNMQIPVTHHINNPRLGWTAREVIVDGSHVVAQLEIPSAPFPVLSRDVAAAPTQHPARTADQAPTHTPAPIAPTATVVPTHTPAPIATPQPAAPIATVAPTLTPAVAPSPTGTSTPIPAPTSAPTPLPEGGDPMDFVLAETESLAVFDVDRAVRGGEASRNQTEWYWEGLQHQMSSLGIAFDQIKLIVSEPDLRANHNWWSVTKGVFDYEAVRAALTETGYAQEWFRDYEVWSTETGYVSDNRSVALLETERIVIYGDFRWVEETLKAASRGVGILDDTMAVSLAMDRAGPGWYVAAYTRCGSVKCEAQAVSASPASEPPYSAKVTRASLFEDDKRGQREAEKYFGYFDGGLVDGRFVVYEEIVDEDDFNRFDWPR